jgi:transcriptional regulator with XRE-family HTH domain
MDVQVDGELVRTERERRAWSQEHLASAAGIGVRTVQRIEASGVASYETLRAISAALEMPVSTLRRDALQQPAPAVTSLAPAAPLAAGRPPATASAAARWLSAAVALAILAGAGGFSLLHDYQKVRVLRTVEHWVTDAAQTPAR